MHALHDEVMKTDYMDTADMAVASRTPLSFWAETAPCCASPGRRRRTKLLSCSKWKMSATVGFMTELEPAARRDKMQALLEGDYQLDSRMMLHVEVERHGRRVYENDALNDIVIAKGTAFRVVRVGISADGENRSRASTGTA